MKRETLYGILLIIIMTVAATAIASIPFVKNTLQFSSLIVGILLGMVFANTLRPKMPSGWASGLRICSKQVLRAGIVLYGFRLTLADIAVAGVPAIVVDLIIVAGTIGLGILFVKMLKMDSDTALMTSVGSAICGAAAVLGAEPVVKCESHKTAVAVSTVVIFGTLSMFLYPIVYRLGFLPLDDFQWSILTGSTLHEVAHVAGAGNAMDSAGAEIAATATITKMIRVILLAPVLVILSIALSGRRAGKGRTGIAVPWFAVLFILVICLNTFLEDIIPADLYEPVFGKGGIVEYADTFMLAMAMTALGADTTVEKFRQAGAKPFALAAMLYLWLLVGGFLLVKFLVPVVQESCAKEKWSKEELALIRAEEDVMRVLTVEDAADSLFLRRQVRDIPLDALLSEDYNLLCAKMLATVTSPEQDGVGIAGPQVGISRRIVAVQRFDKEGHPFEVFPNIRIIAKRGELVPGPEGCLSVPGRRGDVPRYREIDIAYSLPVTRPAVATPGAADLNSAASAESPGAAADDFSRAAAKSSRAHTVAVRDTVETISGFTAVIFQHECDHLDGILYTDFVIIP